MVGQEGLPGAAVRAHEEIFGYWSSLRRGGRLPSRRDIDPAGIKRLLPSVSLTDVLPQGTDFRIRLAGTGLYGVYGGEITGRRLSEVYSNAAADYWRKELGRVAAERRPGVGVHNLGWRGASHLSIVWLRLLLVSDAGEVDMILGYDALVGAAPDLSGIRAA